MGLGALLHDQHPTDNLWARFFKVEIALSAAGAIAVPLLHFSHTGALLLELYGLTFLGKVLFFGTGFLSITTIGILTGFELPVLIDLANTAKDKKRLTNRVLASDYTGSLLGGLAFPLILLPKLSLVAIGLIAATLNVFLATLALYFFLPKLHRSSFGFIVSGSLIIMLGLGLSFAPSLDRYFTKLYYFYWDQSEDFKQLFASMDNTEDVFRVRSPYQRIDLVHDKNGSGPSPVDDFYSSKFVDNPQQPKNYSLFLNGDFQLASNYEEYYHEFFAHIPIMTNGAVPRHVLVMGGGDGLLLRELVKYSDIKTIVHVDLDRELIEQATTHPVLLAMNEGSLSDPRITRHFDDAYRFIRNSSDQFDAIYLDFPDPRDYNLSKLYSREFYHFVRQRLTSDGFIALDSPGLRHNKERREIYTSTLAAAGYQFVTPYISKIETINEAAYEFLLASGYEEEKARRLLASHAASMRLGFITARDNWPDRPIYQDPRVKLHVINDTRLYLTLRNLIPSLAPTDPDKINSIFRPTLPSGNIWHVRDPW